MQADHLKVSDLGTFIPSATLTPPPHLTEYMCRFQRLGCGHLWEVTILPTTQSISFQAAEEHVKALRSAQDGYDGGREGRAMWVHIML